MATFGSPLALIIRIAFIPLVSIIVVPIAVVSVAVVTVVVIVVNTTSVVPSGQWGLLPFDSDPVVAVPAAVAGVEWTAAWFYPY